MTVDSIEELLDSGPEDRGFVVRAFVAHDGDDLNAPLETVQTLRFNKPATMEPHEALLFGGMRASRPMVYGAAGEVEFNLVAKNRGSHSVEVDDAFLLMSGPKIVAHGRILGLTSIPDEDYVSP